MGLWNHIKSLAFIYKAPEITELGWQCSFKILPECWILDHIFVILQGRLQDSLVYWSTEFCKRFLILLFKILLLVRPPLSDSEWEEPDFPSKEPCL